MTVDLSLMKGRTCYSCGHRVEVDAVSKMGACFANPPTAHPFPNGQVVAARPPVNPKDPGCRFWNRAKGGENR